MPPIAPIVGDFTGEAEADWIEATLRTIPDTPVFVTQVDDDELLDRQNDGSVDPYIIVRYANPFASTQGRNIATGEQGQPHILSFTVEAYGGSADDARAVLRLAGRLLVGFRPSLTSSPIKARGGFSYGISDTGSRPTRFCEAGHYRVTVNV